MKRFAFFLVFAFTLGLQSLVLHTYDSHEHEHVCEECITLKKLDHGLALTCAGVGFVATITPQHEIIATGFSSEFSPFYTARAPPVVL